MAQYAIVHCENTDWIDYRSYPNDNRTVIGTIPYYIPISWDRPILYLNELGTSTRYNKQQVRPSTALTSNRQDYCTGTIATNADPQGGGGKTGEASQVNHL